MVCELPNSKDVFTSEGILKWLDFKKVDCKTLYEIYEIMLIYYNFQNIH